MIKKGSTFICSDCGNKQSVGTYSASQRQAKDAVRYGYLYRVKYETDKKGKISGRAYSLIDLNKAFDFFATAIISGIAGNFAYDKLKLIFKKLSKERELLSK